MSRWIDKSINQINFPNYKRFIFHLKTIDHYLGLLLSVGHWLSVQHSIKVKSIIAHFIGFVAFVMMVLRYLFCLFVPLFFFCSFRTIQTATSKLCTIYNSMKGRNPKWNNNHFTRYTRRRWKRKSIQFNDWIEWNGKNRKANEKNETWKYFSNTLIQLIIDWYCLCASEATHKWTSTFERLPRKGKWEMSIERKSLCLRIANASFNYWEFFYVL